MAETYCGKVCSQCGQKEQSSCPGCRVGPGRRYGTQCDIAKCCISRNHQTCQQCNTMNACFTLRNRNAALEVRAQVRDMDEAELQKKYDNCSLLGRWVMVLFWICVCSVVGSILLSFRLSWDPLRVVAEMVVYILNSLIFLRLTPTCGRFRIAGILGLLGGLMSLTEIFVMNLKLTAVLNLVTLGIVMISEYQQFMGMMDTTAIIDRDLAEKWGNLWAAYVVCLSLTAIGLVLTLLGSILGFFAAMASVAGAFGTLVAGVFRITYLYRSGVLFRGYAQNIQQILENNT